MDESRANPDELLKLVQRESEINTRGRIKIFFGYAAGVGKTYTMLKAAHAAQHRGIDVVVGYVEPHSRPQTSNLLNGLECLENQVVTYNNITLHEFDLDAALKRQPEIILVDELAHTNAEGCRHTKRYQDIEELLKAGINVYTTVNVQHIESLNDMVAAITGIMVKERIPDHIFDNADQVELVDIEPEELIERLNAGRIYKQDQAKKALVNFFTVEKLIALREIALRRCADRVNKISEMVRLASNHEYYTDEHILVCLSPSPSNRKIIRTAARMAGALKGSFTALFVETSEHEQMEEEDKKRLRENIYLAEQLGAKVETVFGDDIALQIAEFARVSGVSKIVVGRNNARKKYFFSMPTLTERLAQYSPNLDIYIIPDHQATPYERKMRKKRTERRYRKDIFRSALLFLASTAIGGLFFQFGFSEANIIMVYILGVLLTAIVTTERMYSLFSSILSVIIFNFFFTEPRFTFNAYDSGYPVTFLIMFLSAFITSSLAVKLKQHAKQFAETAYRTKILLETNQLLQLEKEKRGIIEVTASQMTKLLKKDIVFYSVENGVLAKPNYYPATEENKQYLVTSENEQAVAMWVFKNNKRAGATTNTLGNSKCLYLAVRINDTVYGVVGIALCDEVLDSFEKNIVLSILGECALALENESVAREREEAAILARNEQLRANLLRSISHDLRTPLTSISGNAGVLLSNEEVIDKEKRHMLYQTIYDDSLWLINLVENLLSVTRIEDGTMSLNLSAELMEEVINEAIHHIHYRKEEHTIVVKQNEGFILAKMDARLIVQVIINIIDNAIKYTERGSVITISTKKHKKEVIVEIADDGPGISEEGKQRIFDMFYTENSQVADSRRSLGLGLSLCKSIITAHRGTISVRNNKPRGTIFRFTLPTEEVVLNE